MKHSRKLGKLLYSSFLILVLWLITLTGTQARGSLPLGVGPDSQAISLPNTLANVGCDHTIELNVTKADAKTNYASVKPGDVVCIAAGKRSSLLLRNFRGSPNEPITFINFGGKVVFNNYSDVAFKVRNSRYLHITGTGDPSIDYGFKINGNYAAGVRFNNGSSNIELDHFEVSNTNGSGIMAKSEPTCSDGSTNTDDLDGDGKIVGDPDDVINRKNFTQYDTIIHDNYLHDIGHEGFYIGGSHYEEGQILKCDSGRETVQEPILDGVQIYNNIIENTGWDGLQVSSAPNGNCDIYNNWIYNDSRENRDAQRSGIGNGKGGACNIYNNFVKNGNSKGIRFYVYNDVVIRDNIIIEPGQQDIDGGNGIWAFPGFGVSGKRVVIEHNTIVNPSATGIKFGFLKDSNAIIQNNLIVDQEKAYIDTGADALATIGENFTARDVSQVMFANPENDNYALLPDSPAVGFGANVQPIMSADDETSQLKITTQQESIYPGDSLTLNLKVDNAKDLYGLQITCAVDPTVLAWENVQFGDFFSAPLIGAREFDSETGIWLGAVSQKFPAAALSDDGLYALLEFKVIGSGSAKISCEPVASDKDGFELPMLSAEATLAIDNVMGGIEGLVAFQGRTDHAGITVSVEGSQIGNLSTDNSGKFLTPDLNKGDYGFRADAQLHLPSCTTVTVVGGQTTAIEQSFLAGGDTDDDDEIRINDATLIGSNFGLSSQSSPAMNANADINADGEVDVKDLAIFGGNFGKQGCQDWFTETAQ